MNALTLEGLAREVRRLRDIHEIQNLMGRSTYMYTAGMYEEMVQLFAVDRDDISAQISGGERCTGLEGVRSMMVDYWMMMINNHTAAMKQAFPEDENPTGRNGWLDLQALSSPVIEVAEDGMTAKGLWLAPSIATECRPGSAMPEGHNVWLRFAVDFIKEPDGWKFWHYRILPAFNTVYSRDWVQSSLQMEEMFAKMGQPPRDHVNIGPDEFRAYSVHEAPRYFPAPPEPYKTFDETFRY